MAAARRLSKTTIDWAKFAEKIPKDEVGHFQQLKSKTESFVTRVASYPEKLPEIDFAQFKARAGAMASVVEQFEKTYKSMAIPFPKDEANVLSQIEKDKLTQEASFKTFVTESNKRMAQMKLELAKWEKIPPFEHMTKEEWNTYFPDKAVLDPRKPPTLWPHDAEENDPILLAKQSNYKVPKAEVH